jgi:hypothetical protein
MVCYGNGITYDTEVTKKCFENESGGALWDV